MRYPLAFLGLAAQVPVQNPIGTPVKGMVNETPKFAFKEAPDIFSPKDLIQLGRPGQGVANPDGNFALVPYSKHSLEEKKSTKSVYIVSLGSHATDPIHIPLQKGGEYFWLASRTFAHVITEDDEAQIFAYNINLRC